MGGRNNCKVVDCTQQEMLMFYCSVWLRIVLMVQLIVCTVWELNKERHLTAGLMNAPPKRPQCVLCGVFLKVDICASPFPLPRLICLYAMGTYSLALCGVKTAAAPPWQESPEHHVDPWKLKVRVDVAGSTLLSPLKLWHGTAAGQSRAALDCMHPWRESRLTMSDGKTKFIRTCSAMPKCMQKNKQAHINPNTRNVHVKGILALNGRHDKRHAKKGKALCS